MNDRLPSERIRQVLNALDATPRDTDLHARLLDELGLQVAELIAEDPTAPVDLGGIWNDPGAQPGRPLD